MSAPQTQKELAGALGVAKQRLSEWKRLGCPIPSKGPYDVASVLAWVKVNLPKSKLSMPIVSDAGTGETQASIRLRKLVAETELKTPLAEQEKLKLAKMRGELIEVEAAQQKQTAILSEAVQMVFASIDAMATDLANASDPNEDKAHMRAYYTKEFNRLSG